jgi:hypothetical protein
MPQSQLEQKDIVRIIAFAVIVDVIEVPLYAIPFIGWIIVAGIDVIAWITFYFMFRRKSVHFNNFKRFLYFNSGLILDLVPFINVFAWTIDVMMVIWTVKQEDRERMTLSQ